MECLCSGMNVRYEIFRKYADFFPVQVVIEGSALLSKYPSDVNTFVHVWQNRDGEFHVCWSFNWYPLIILQELYYHQL